MNLTDQVEEYLQREPLFRERKKKDNGIANLLMKNYPVLKNIDRAVVVAICQDYASMDRYWRMITRIHPELRGTDYDDKAALEEIKQMELGYGQQPLIEK